MLRLLDSYLPLAGSHTYPRPSPDTLLNIPSSRFLRPYTPRLKRLDSLRLHRITSAMSQAAQKGEVFHLWWHPHNFGQYLDENMLLLEHILQAFTRLRDQYGMQSCAMCELLPQAKVSQ